MGINPDLELFTKNETILENTNYSKFFALPTTSLGEKANAEKNLKFLRRN